MNQDHVIDPGEFLDRSRDRADIAQRLRDGRNLLLYGPRRIGKTALLKRLEHDLKSEVVFLRRDCYFFTDAQDFAEAIFDAIGQSGIAKLKRFKQKVLDYAKGLRFGVEVRDGAIIPHVQLGTPPEHILEDALRFLVRVAHDSKQPIVLSLDEFQTVMQWHDRTVHMLRSYAQQEPNLQIVLTGSQPSILLALTQAKNPYWKQLTEVPIGPVDLDEFCDDYQKQYGFKVTAAARDILRAQLGEYTMELVHVLEICRTRLKGSTKPKVEQAIEYAIQDNMARYQRIIGHEVSTPLQRRILYALAKHQPRAPMSQAFVQQHRLGSPGTVQKAIKRFQDLEIMDDDRRFLDPLFRRYLADNTS